MSSDQPARSAGRIATLVALPVALVAGFVAFQVLKPSSPAPTPSPTPRVIATGPVAVVAAQLSAGQASVCKALVTGMPTQMRGLPRRPVTGATDQAAAYGEAVIRCGGPQPSFAPADLVYPISGVCWVPDEAGTRWSTVDRDVPIVIELGPGEAGQGSGQWAAAFSELVGKTVPPLAARPTGCGG